MSYLFTSESVSEGHPDKLADQISDALLDEFLRHDPDSKVACETLVTTGLITLAGEVRTKGYVEVQDIARKVANAAGYTKQSYMFSGDSCGVISSIHEQSPDIRQGVDRNNPEEQGAGDQGIMFGYACNESKNFMPLTLELSHIILKELAEIRKEGKMMKYLGPDSKSQVTIEYSNEGIPLRIDTIIISTQHDEFIIAKNDSLEEIQLAEKQMQDIITSDIIVNLYPRIIKHLDENTAKLFIKENHKLLVNPTGKFVIGGPHGDTGLTGRKIIVDTYGGRCPHGGGAFSGKDSSKVDRSAAYAARYIAKNMVAAGVADEMLVQISYAIGIAKPISIYVNTYKTGIVFDNIISEAISNIFNLSPYHITKYFNLKNPIFYPTAKYGHFGKESYEKEIEIYYTGENVITKIIDGKERFFKNVTFFPWEKLDMVNEIKKYFNISV